MAKVQKSRIRFSEPEWEEFCKTLDEWVVKGQHRAVKAELKRLNLRRIPRKWASILAEVAWRISSPLLTVKILHRFIHPSNSLAQAPTAREKMAYGSALANLGAIDEALQLLDEVDSGGEPEVLLRKSIVYFKTWNYEAARPLLLDYVNRAGVSEYRRLIGQVNLAACLVNLCQWEEAQDLLSHIQHTCMEKSHWLLLGNCFELQGQVAFFQQNFDLALSLLDRALEHLQNQEGDFYLYAEKWRQLSFCFKVRDSKSALVEYLSHLSTIRTKAQDLLHWETIREMDLFEAILKQDDELCRKVLIGTPWAHYRNRIRRLYGTTAIPLGRFVWTLGSTSGNVKTYVFDPYEKQNGQESLYDKPLLLAAFGALTSDLYKPSHIGGLFQKLYTNEKFDPYTSPERVLKAIKRLNQWFISNQVPVRVHLKKSEFCLMAQEGHQVKIMINRGKKLTKEEGHFHQIKELFQDRSFTVQKLSEQLQVSTSTARSIVTKAIEADFLIKMGQGRNISYRLKTRIKKRKAA